MTKLKIECSPQEWADHLARSRARRLARVEAERARLREYTARPEVKARRALRDANPEAVARRRAYAQTPEAKARAKELYEQKRADPERWGKILERQRVDRTGITSELFTQLMDLQQGACAVCRRPFDGRQVRADHCHDTKTPRGLLCHHCNIVEGMLRGMALSLEEFGHRLSEYLKRPPVVRLR